MSRIGNAVISVPTGVDININGDRVDVKGAKGLLMVSLFSGLSLSFEDNKIVVKRENDMKSLKAKHGLFRSLLFNCVKGVTEGFSKVLLLQGVGYRAVKKGNDLVLSLGFSHDVIYKQPDGIQIDVLEPTKIKISGIDKQKVGEVSAQIRKFRKPEPYKGKGIRYENEVIIRKAGKTGKKK